MRGSGDGIGRLNKSHIEWEEDQYRGRQVRPQGQRLYRYEERE